MFKNVKTKIILISLIIGIITVSILGGIYLKTTQNLLEFAKQDNNFSDINNQINIIQQQTQITVIAAIVMLILVALIITKILSKFVIYPKNKFIKKWIK